MAKSASPCRVRQVAPEVLLQLDRADVAFGLVVGKRHCQVNGEPQDHVPVVAKAAGPRQSVLAVSALGRVLLMPLATAPA